ncbi:MAG: MFS transporter [Chloroflexi bacterium]|nr:MAG: MFS transporter [Chloroflexota bacterium]
MGLDRLQRDTLVWAGLAVVLAGWDGSVLVLELPAVAQSFGARVADISNLGSIVIFGAVGALPLATLADHFGRRRLIAAGVALFSLVNFATAFAPSLLALAAVRLTASCFENLVLGVVTALVVEEAPTARRGQAVSALALLFGLGQGIPVLIYPLVAPNWRVLFLAGGIGVLAAPLIWRRLPEGRAWQRAHVSGSTMRLLAQSPWRRRVLILAASVMVGTVLGEPAGLFFTVYASQTLHLSPFVISAMIVAAAVCALVGYVAGGYLSDRYGRRILGAALGAVTAVFTGGGFISGAGGFIAGNLLWSGFASAGTPVMGAWSGELYPTRARATAEATGGVAAAMGGIIGLQIVGALSPVLGLGRSLAVLAAAGVLSAALLLLLPETRGRPLPD